MDDRLRRVGGTRHGRAPRRPQGDPVRPGQGHDPLRGRPSCCRSRVSALPATRPQARRTADGNPVADARRCHADVHCALPRAQAVERRTRSALLPRAVRFAGSVGADRGSRPQHRRRDHVRGIRGNGARPQHPRRAGDCAPRPARTRAPGLSRRRRSTAAAFRWPRGATQRRHEPARARFRRRAFAAAPLVARRARLGDGARVPDARALARQRREAARRHRPWRTAQRAGLQPGGSSAALHGGSGRCAYSSRIGPCDRRARRRTRR